MSNPNLHPVWAKALGITPQATSPSTSAETQLSPLAAAIAAMTGQTHSHRGWQATSHPRRPGAPVGIKKQAGPGLWISTVARPGDTHYPVLNRTPFGGRHEATMSVIHGRPVRSPATNREPAVGG